MGVAWGLGIRVGVRFSSGWMNREEEEEEEEEEGGI